MVRNYSLEGNKSNVIVPAKGASELCLKHVELQKNILDQNDLSLKSYGKIFSVFSVLSE